MTTRRKMKKSSSRKSLKEMSIGVRAGGRGRTNEPVEVPENLNTRGIAFLAARDVSPGEEIYFNYQLSKRGAPAWYAPVPVEVMWEILEKGNA
jgi:hypothetical protein